MAEMKREVAGEIGASLVKPPQENAILSGVKGMLEIDQRYSIDQLQADQQFEQERFQAEGMEAKLQVAEGKASGVGTTVFNGNSTASAEPLDPKDAGMLSDTAKALRTNADGLQQGATSYTQSLINQERILKNAIRSRPWLKDELLAASSAYLGMDVYQQGYKALAANEAARADAKNAEMKAAQDDLEAVGNRAWDQNIPQTFMSLFPDSQSELNTMSPAETAVWLKANKDNPQLKQAMYAVTMAQGFKAQVALETNKKDLNAIQVDEVMKERTRNVYADLKAKAEPVFSNKDFYDANGGLNPLGAQKVGDWAASTRISLKSALLDNLPAGADYVKAEEKVAVLNRVLDDMVNAASGKEGQALSKSILDQHLDRIAYLVQTSPELANASAYLLKANPGLASNPTLLNTMSANFGGITLAGAKQADVATFYRDNGPAASTTLQGAVTDMQKTLDPVQKATARSGVRKLLLGGTVNLTQLAPETMLLDPAMRNIATSTFVDLKRALLTPDKGVDDKGQPTRVIDNLSGADKVVVGTAMLKSAINIQLSLIDAPKSDSALKRFATKGEGRKFLAMADGTIKADLPGPLSPAEQRYMALVGEHNKRVAGVGAIYNTAVGVPPETRIEKSVYDAVKSVSILPPSASTYTHSGFSMMAPAVLGNQGGAGKKPQGAEAPKEAPIGIRNNNPGNLRTGEGGAFGSYSTMREGIKAAEDNLMAYQRKHGINTIKAAVSRWAPREDNNDTDAYINHVVRVTGIPKDQPIDFTDKDTRRSVLMAMFEMENGPKWKSYWQ